MKSFTELSYAAYGALPVALQNVAISCWGIHSRTQRYGTGFYATLERLRRSEWWTREQIDEYRLRRLKDVVARAYQNTEFYRRSFDDHGVRPEDIQSLTDLQSLPILTRASARRRGAALLDRTFEKRHLRTFTTSGTTGSPFKIFYTPEALITLWAVGWRHRARFGVMLGDPFLSFGVRLPIRTMNPRPPVWRENWALGQTYISVDHLTKDSMPSVVDMMNQRRFVCFAGYPSAMHVLARFIEETGLRLYHRPRCIMSASESLHADEAATIRRAFGAEVTEFYGMVEGAGAFSKCEAGKYHEDFELGIAELLPSPELPDGRFRRIVLTGLQNPAMPFIRYDTGDIALVDEAKCSCGRQTATVAAIDGRIEDYIRTLDGRYVVDINTIFKASQHVSEGQVVQDGDDALKVYLAPMPGFSSDVDIPLLRAQLMRRVGTAMKISFESVEHVPRLASGKMRARWYSQFQPANVSRSS
jgi:phenylacetate-CoA ligase